VLCAAEIKLRTQNAVPERQAGATETAKNQTDKWNHTPAAS
jgi:hypothetical protein